MILCGQYATFMRKKQRDTQNIKHCYLMLCFFHRRVYTQGQKGNKGKIKFSLADKTSNGGIFIDQNLIHDTTSF